MRRRRKGRREHGGVCMNGAKPGASACFWVKGGADVLVGRSVNQSIGSLGNWRREGGKWRAGARVIAVLNCFDLRTEKCFGHCVLRKGEVSPHEEGGRVSCGVIRAVKWCTRHRFKT